ncbi:MAG: hypothetical protein Q8909_08440 [Bacteroidota bacterium]|nr:hypothetical protein [Bacteroidota bacterium]
MQFRPDGSATFCVISIGTVMNIRRGHYKKQQHAKENEVDIIAYNYFWNYLIERDNDGTFLPWSNLY